MKTSEMLDRLEWQLNIEGHQYDSPISRLIRICHEQQRIIDRLLVRQPIAR
jgi:hypothetical protein